ncbi:hypothetical protein C8F01DRAFT_1107899 [Mycena amicta]|nr:hypothetical protein C8F01DRAFT_1107899 [Mycena amicta]
MELTKPSRPLIVQLDGPTGRPLRRKKSFYRISAPAQSPVTEMAIEIPVVRPQSMISVPVASKHVRSESLRLGHPRRPYYSAIRSNMSRPSSPQGSPPRPGLSVEEHDLESPVISPNSRFRIGFGALSPPSNPGFSVSGEIEMRMALADLARQSRGEQEHQPHSLGRRVKKLRKGLRDLVRRKHA